MEDNEFLSILNIKDKKIDELTIENKKLLVTNELLRLKCELFQHNVEIKEEVKVPSNQLKLKL